MSAQLIRERSAEDLLRELRERGARRLRRVVFRRNRSTIWSLTQNATVLNLHVGYASSGDDVLDALAVIVRKDGRDTPEVRRARKIVQDCPRLAAALAETHSKHSEERRVRAACSDDADVTHCCATPDQRRYLKALYRYFNQTRFGGVLPADIPIRLSNRMKSALGHMLPEYENGAVRSVAEIALNVDLMLPGNGAERVDTLLHEMAHAADYLFDGNRGHGPTWRAWAEKAGCRPDRIYNRPMVRRRRRTIRVTRVPPLPASLLKPQANGARTEGP